MSEEYRVLLLASYCDDNCTEDFPCDECLKLCNILIIPKDSIIENLGVFKYNKEQELK